MISSRSAVRPSKTSNPPGDRRPDRIGRLAVILLTALCSTALLPGCTLDFDEFETTPGQTGDAADVGPGVDGTTDATGDAGDIDATDTTEIDTGPPPFVLGNNCSEDRDCGADGTCLEGYCTRECQADEECGADGKCASLNGERRCVLECTDQRGCPMVDGRQDLDCTTVDRRAELGARSTRISACMPDGDDDTVADFIDNCPGRANATQSDRDGDGKGDPCDSRPLCHSATTMGKIELGETSHAPDAVGIPSLFDGSTLAVLGGRDSDAKPVETISIADLASESWKSPKVLPYAAESMMVTPLAGADGFVSSPGKTTTSSSNQLGRLLFVDADGDVEIGGEFNIDADKTAMATDGRGETYVIGHDPDAPGGATRTIWRFSKEKGRFETLYRQRTGDTRQWYATASARGEVVFYSEPTTDSMGATEILVGFLNNGAENAGDVDFESYQLPDIADGMKTRPMNPFVLTGMGKRRLYLFDRQQGTAAIVDRENDTVTKQPVINLELPFPVEHVATNPSSSGFVLFGPTAGDSPKIQATGYYPSCFPTLSNLDTDGDGAGDLTDNCPVTPNNKQGDADGDRIGDGCDLDADNDGIPNGEDVETDSMGNTVKYRLDTDNDGLQNANDDDIDADGITNDRDPFPLDTDNDGEPNRTDGDDDGDGYSDSLEDEGSAESLDPLALPVGKEVSFVQKPAGSSGMRRVKIGSLAELSAASAVIAEQYDAHQPRLYADGNGVVALSGPPDSTTSIVWWRRAPEGPMMMGMDREATKTANLMDSLRGVDVMSHDQNRDPTAALVVRKSPMAQTWEIADYTFSDQMFEPIVTTFQQVIGLDFDGSRIGFGAGPSGCPACLSLYRVDTGGQRVELIGGVPGELEQLNYHRGHFGARTLIDGEARGYTLDTTDSRAVMPPGAVAVDSIAPLNTGGHLLVSAKSEGGSYNIWLYNGRNERWYRALESADDLIEIDWIR